MNSCSFEHIKFPKPYKFSFRKEEKEKWKDILKAFCCDTDGNPPKECCFWAYPVKINKAHFNIRFDLDKEETNVEALVDFCLPEIKDFEECFPKKYAHIFCPLIDCLPKTNAENNNEPSECAILKVKDGCETIVPYIKRRVPGTNTHLRVLIAKMEPKQSGILKVFYKLKEPYVVFDKLNKEKSKHVRTGFFMGDLLPNVGFLEQYGPANLEYDQFPLSLRLKIEDKKINASFINVIHNGRKVKKTKDNTGTIKYEMLVASKICEGNNAIYSPEEYLKRITNSNNGRERDNNEKSGFDSEYLIQYPSNFSPSCHFLYITYLDLISECFPFKHSLQKTEEQIKLEWTGFWDGTNDPNSSTSKDSTSQDSTSKDSTSQDSTSKDSASKDEVSVEVFRIAPIVRKPEEINLSKLKARLKAKLTGQFLRIKEVVFRGMDEMIVNYGSYPYERLIIFDFETRTVRKDTGRRNRKQPKFSFNLVSRAGMEYAGALTASINALDHEIAHMWFGRGVFPRNGNAGFLDEAIVVWRELGYRSIPWNEDDWKKAICLVKGNLNPLVLGAFSEYTKETNPLAYTVGPVILMCLDGCLREVVKDKDCEFSDGCTTQKIHSNDVKRYGLRAVLRFWYLCNKGQIISIKKFEKFIMSVIKFFKNSKGGMVSHGGTQPQPNGSNSGNFPKEVGDLFKFFVYGQEVVVNGSSSPNRVGSNNRSLAERIVNSSKPDEGCDDQSEFISQKSYTPVTTINLESGNNIISFLGDYI